MFGEEPSDRLQLRSPYDVIYYWQCYNCPSLNGLVSMDRHLASLLKALSFPDLYRSTAKTANILNTVAQPMRQMTRILPNTQHSQDIPDQIFRRSQNSRLRVGGVVNPLYNLSYTPAARSSTTALPPTSAPGAGPSTTAQPPASGAEPSTTAQPPTPAPGAGPSTTAQPPTQMTGSERQDNDMNNNRGASSNDSNMNTFDDDDSTQTFDNPTPSTSSSVPHCSHANDEAAAPDLLSMPSNAFFDSGIATSPGDLLERYLKDLDPNNIFAIPDESHDRPNQSESLLVSHLQRLGLLNDSNICALISVMLCFHRISLKNHMIDPFSLTLDYSAMVFHKVLSALPSQQPFSLQLLIDSWNESGKTPRIHPGFSDIAALAEGLVSNLQLKQYRSGPPFFTEFLGTFHCSGCGKDFVQVRHWEQQVGALIPLLPLPANNQPVDITELMDAYLNEPFETRCSNSHCRQIIYGGRLEPRSGMFTILAVNRFDVDNPNQKRLNKLVMPSYSETTRDLLEDLVSVSCHRGDVNAGHFVSYHKVNGQWYLNNDSRPCLPCENPLEGLNISVTETVELLFFKTPV